ncbi:UNVERIFIED_CONTAM: putative mitochondrial protein [Sesamum angustifolium]|uniref:Mitochondrial protein n=1 Tax=Sesamum angustifolium TaxID=2727405 RepID=A0AAW2M5N9_9LAMI
MELYLGLPSSVARTKRALFATIRDRIWQKISGWNETLLSQAGKELHLFNLAMLAKQLWRIILFPERLLSKVLKARYFPNGDIFTATLGSRPSYTWRSIMAAFDLFRAGCRWRVGSGLLFVYGLTLGYPDRPCSAYYSSSCGIGRHAGFRSYRPSQS